MITTIKRAVIVYTGTAIASLVMLAAKVFIDRELGTAVLGQYELGLSVILMVSVFAMFGFHTSIARTVAKKGLEAYPLVRKAFIWVAVVCGIVILLANPIVNRIYEGKVDPNFVLYLSLFLYAVCLLNLNMAFYQGKQEMEKVSKIMALDSFARGAAVLVALRLAFDARSLLLMIGVFALVFELVVTSRILKRVASVVEETIPFRELAHLSFFIFLIAASGAVSTRVSAFVIAYSLDSLNLGWFGQATLFILPLSLLGKTIETVLLPRASSKEDFQLRKFAVVALGMAIFMILAYQAMSGFLVEFLFGPGNDPAIKALNILSLGYAAIIVYSVFSGFVFGRAQRDFLGKLVTVTFLQALILSPTLNAYLVNMMGLSGAAWATSISLIAQAGLWVTAGLILERSENLQKSKKISS